MEEREVLLDDGEQRDDGRLQVLTVEHITVFCHVSGGIKEVLEILE